MKRLMVVFFALLLMVGCAGMQLQDEPTTNATAYLAGKSLGVAITTLAPVAVVDLETAWDDMMARNQDVDMIPAEEIIRYYGSCIGVIGLHTEDPYGLLMDLGVLLTIFGAQFDVNGEMIEINPVPKMTMTYFAMGWDNGKMVAR